ncbi:MerR family transcriptional regulator [Aciditerrimonas ferrireducens]|nr:MerR family transcriptional regulator [Aciditerrimonas ferrireducens]MCK4176657.1 MerR family transcriptional regulator [Aciditerrimonas ferrireducens]
MGTPGSSAVGHRLVGSVGGRGGRTGRGAPEDPGEAGFSGPQACGIVGITYRQLDYWARTGLVRPSIADAHGSGSQRRYAYRDLVELKVIKQLLDGGVSLQRARRAIECLRQSLGVDLAAASLVLAGPTTVLARSDGEVVDLLRGGQGVLNIVPLGGVVEAIDDAVHRVVPGPGTLPLRDEPEAADVGDQAVRALGSA